jgi:hypothetical protein
MKTWIGLTAQERKLLLDAMSAVRSTRGKGQAAIDELTLKLIHAPSYPDITVGVHGGQVQWTRGNPFPIRICDYDGEEQDLLDVDRNGERCRMWLEPASRCSTFIHRSR